MPTAGSTAEAATAARQRRRGSTAHPSCTRSADWAPGSTCWKWFPSTGRCAPACSGSGATARPTPHERDVDDLTRFNESIDQSVTKAVSSYTKRVDQSRDLFLAILSHDLRNPLNSIAMSAELLPQLCEPDPEAVPDVASQISTNAAVMARMISDLLDYTRTRLGAGMPVSPAPMDLGSLVPGVVRRVPHRPPEPRDPLPVPRAT